MPLIPQLPSFWEKEEQLAQKRQTSHIVDPKILMYGQAEKEIQRAQTIGQAAATPLEQPEPEPVYKNVSQAYHGVAEDLSNPQKQKDSAWWQKALGSLSVLGYLDIPAELLISGVEGVVPGKWAGEGTAERDDFEAWNALFGQDQGSIKERLDKAAGAFEKRPLWMQLGVGAAQIAATGGAAAFAKAGAVGGTNAGRITAALAKSSAMAVDPAELGIKAIGKSVKAGRAFVDTSILRRDSITGHVLDYRALTGFRGMHQAGSDMPFGADDIIGRTEGFADAEVRDRIVQNWHRMSSEEQLEHMFRYNSTDGELFPKYGPIREGSKAEYEVRHTTKDTPWNAEDSLGMSPVLDRGNEFRRLFGDISKDIREDIKKGTITDETMRKSRNLALLQLTLSMASRPNAVSKVTIKDLKNFLATGRLKVTAGKGERSGNLRALDELQSQAVITNYMNMLEEFASRHGIKLDDNMKAFGFEFDKAKSMGAIRKGTDGLTSRIIKSYQGAKPAAGQPYRLTDAARHIRNQRVSELWLEGNWEFADLMAILGHSNAEMTRGYLHDIDVYIGKPQDTIKSVPLAKLMAGSGILEQGRNAPKQIDPETEELIDPIADKIDILKGVLKSAAADGVVGKRKGKVPGGAEGQELIIEVGETFLRSNELMNFGSPWDWAELERVMTSGDFIGTRAVRISHEAISLKGLRNLAMNMKMGYDIIENKRMGIYSATKSKTSRGKLNRAGYTIVEGELKGVRGTMSAENKAMRKAYGEETGLGDFLKTDADWDKWALGLAEERKSLKDILDTYAFLTKKDGKKSGSHLLHDTLFEFIDAKARYLHEEWVTEMHFGQTGRMDEWINDEINTLMLVNGHAAAGRTYNAGVGTGIRIATNKFNAQQRVSETIDPLDWDIGIAKVPGSTKEGLLNATNHTWKNHQIGKWINEPAVVEALTIARLNYDSSYEAIRRKLNQLASNKNTAGIFGRNFPGIAGDEYVAKEFLDELANRIVLNREDFLQGFKKQNLSRFEQFLKGDLIFNELRHPLPDMGDVHKFNGIPHNSLVATESVTEVVARVHPGVKWMTNLTAHDKGFFGLVSRYAIQPALSLSLGGKAMFGRNIIRPFAARAHLYKKHEGDAREVQTVLRQLFQKKLGIVTVEATPEMKMAGIHEGNQYLGGLELQDIADIRAFESQTAIRRRYADVGRQAGNKNGFYPPMEKVAKVTDSGGEAYTGRLGGEGLENPENMIKQVDVVLERILPEHWGKYFKGMTNAEGEYTELWHSLMYIKAVQDQIDRVAKKRGVDVVGRIQDKGGTYLESYFPRIFNRGDDKVRLGSSASDVGELAHNNFVGHFLPRATKKEDVLDVLADSLNTQGKQLDVLHNSVFQSADTRLAMYYETMMKEGTDMETKKLLSTSKYTDSSADLRDFAVRDSDLDNLQRILNDRRAQTKMSEMSGKRIEQLTNSNKTGQYSWILGEDVATLNRVNTEYADIMKWIGDERRDLGYEMGEAGVREGHVVLADNWMDTVLKKLSTADQRAVREQLTMAAPALLQPLAYLGKSLYGFTNILRTLKAGIDMGAPMIHGYNALVRLPMMDGKFDASSQKAWIKAFKEMGESWWHPDHLDDYIVNNFAIRQEAGRWVKLGHSEPLAAGMGGSNMMQTVRENLGRRGWTPSVIDRFESGFVAYTDVLRIELYKSFQPTVARDLKRAHKGIDVNNLSDPRVIKAYHEMGAVINKMTGVFDQELAGMTPLQRILESSIFFFAPMYRRATYGVMADIGRGGMRQREALKQLSGVMVVGGMMSQLSQLAGNERGGFFRDDIDLENLDMTARFGKFNAGGTQTGIGTAWWTVFRFASDVGMLAAGHDKGIEEADDNIFWDNPIWGLVGRRGRSQLAPGMGVLLDTIQGRTFLGDPLRDAEGENDYLGMGLHIGSAAVPFWLDSLAGGAGKTGMPIMMASEFFGFQSYEIGEWDKLSTARESVVQTWDYEPLIKWRKKQAREGGEINYLALPKILQNEVNDTHPQLIVLNENFKEVQDKIATGNSRLFMEYSTEKSSIEKKAVEMQAWASLAFEKGDISAKDLRVQLSAAQQMRFHSGQALLESPKYLPLSEWFVALRVHGAKDIDKRFQGDIIWAKYQEAVVDNQANYNEDGSWNAENFNLLRQDFIRQGGKNGAPLEQEWLDYIESRSDAWKKVNPVVQEYEEAKDDLAPYWKVHDTLWQVGSKAHQDAVWYVKQADYQKKALRDSSPIYKNIQKKIDRARESLRRNNSHLDWLLTKWYDMTPIHTANEVRRDMWRSQQEANNLQYLQFPQTWPYRTPETANFFISAGGRIVNDPIRGPQRNEELRRIRSIGRNQNNLTGTQ